MTFVRKSKLPRLQPEWYRGRAVVFWTHTFEGRVTGWLTNSFHGFFREALIHACGRYRIACPIYVLMPDHWHLVWMGLTGQTDQLTATRFLRGHLQPHLGGCELQDRAHDSVLREDQRKKGAFADACEYVRENPVRAGLVNNWQAWPYSGAVIPGYPDFDPRENDFWEQFWKVYNRLVDERARERVPALPSRATQKP